VLPAGLGFQVLAEDQLGEILAVADVLVEPARRPDV
jgi:hypothetical protein